MPRWVDRAEVLTDFFNLDGLITSWSLGYRLCATRGAAVRVCGKMRDIGFHDSMMIEDALLHGDPFQKDGESKEARTRPPRS